MGEPPRPTSEPGEVRLPTAIPGVDPATTVYLAAIGRRIASSLDLNETLQQVVQDVVDHLGFGAAVINLVRPDSMCEVVAAAGPPEASTALLGIRASMEVWYQILAECEPWGQLRFLDHRRDQRIVRSVASWIPPGDASPEPQAWHPLDMPQAWHPLDILLAPLSSPHTQLWPSRTPASTLCSPTPISCSARHSTAPRSRSHCSPRTACQRAHPARPHGSMGTGPLHPT